VAPPLFGKFGRKPMKRKNPMKKNSPFNIGPKTPSTYHPDDPQNPPPIKEWQQRFENYLSSIDRKSTRNRYSRALDRFLGASPGRKYPHQYLRPEINSYVKKRFDEGASLATIRTEMSAIKGLFGFMYAMGCVDLMFDPTVNVKVCRPEKHRVSRDRMSDGVLQADASCVLVPPLWR
jgi:hypothetical protein